MTNQSDASNRGSRDDELPDGVEQQPGYGELHPKDEDDVQSFAEDAERLETRTEPSGDAHGMSGPSEHDKATESTVGRTARPGDQHAASEEPPDQESEDQRR